MRTKEKYKKMGFTIISDTKVIDRHGDIFFPKKAESPLKAIRLFCLECAGMDRRSADGERPFDDIRECTDPMCPLFDFRLGKNPFHTLNLSDEQRKAIRTRFSMVRKR